MSLVKSIKHKSYLIATTKHQKHRNHLKYNLKVSSFECIIRFKILLVLLSKIVAEELSLKNLITEYGPLEKTHPFFRLLCEEKEVGRLIIELRPKSFFLLSQGFHIIISSSSRQKGQCSRDLGV